jgi:hypothetical protein
MLGRFRHRCAHSRACRCAASTHLSGTMHHGFVHQGTHLGPRPFRPGVPLIDDACCCNGRWGVVPGVPYLLSFGCSTLTARPCSRMNETYLVLDDFSFSSGMHQHATRMACDALAFIVQSFHCQVAACHTHFRAPRTKPSAFVSSLPMLLLRLFVSVGEPFVLLLFLRGIVTTLSAVPHSRLPPLFHFP